MSEATPLSFKPVSEMTPEEITAEARRILLSPTGSRGTSARYRSIDEGYEEQRRERDSGWGGVGELNTISGSARTRSALKQQLGHNVDTDNLTSRSDIPRDTFGDDSRVDYDVSEAQRSGRRVVVTDDCEYAEDRVEMIDLPLSMALLYQAAYSVQTKRSCENLKKLLLDVAIANSVRRLTEESEANRLRNDACLRLFVQSGAQRTKLDEKRSQLREKFQEAELKECSFKPSVSHHAQQVRRVYHTPSGKVDFVAMSKQSDEWLKTREKKLKAKALKNETERLEAIKDAMVPMSSKSKLLAERYREKQAEKKVLEAALAEITMGGYTECNVSAYCAESQSPMTAMSPIAHEGSPTASNAEACGGGPEERGTQQHQTDAASPHSQQEDLTNATTLSAHDANPPPAPNSSGGSVSMYRDPMSHVDATLISNMQCYRRGALADRANQTYYPSFEPVTNSASTYDHYFSPTREAMSPQRSRAGGAVEGPIGGTVTPGRSGGDAEEGQTAVNARITQRLLDDVEQRKIRQEQRLIEAEERRKEKLFDPLTGQPFFQPNAVPTVMVGKKRVPVSDLPQREREEAIRILGQKKLDFLLTVAKRKENDGSPQRDINAFLKYCDEMQAQAARRMEKIRRLEDKELEGLFVPVVDPNSRKIAAHKSQEKLYKQPLPRKEPPPPPPPKRESDAEAIKTMLERSKQWEDRRAMLKNRKNNEVKKEEMQECTFAPKLRSRVSAEMTAAAEQRLAGELAMLRLQQQEMHRIEQEREERQRASGRMASQSVRSVDRSSVASFHSQQYEVTSGAMRRERSVMDECVPLSYDNGSPMSSNNAKRRDPANTHNIVNDGVGGSHYGAAADRRTNSADDPVADSLREEKRESNHYGQAARSYRCESRQPPQPAEETDLDNLIASWKELDELTDNILNGGV